MLPDVSIANMTSASPEQAGEPVEQHVSNAFAYYISVLNGLLHRRMTLTFSLHSKVVKKLLVPNEAQKQFKKPRSIGWQNNCTCTAKWAETCLSVVLK